LRIIGGTAKGRSILAPKGITTRPTGDRVKESMFNIIQGYVRDSKVLDLFAGSGNLGLEALSRGAKHAVFVDKDRTSIQVIKKNIDTLGFASRSTAICADYKKALGHLKINNETFDLVFLDPPYKLGILPLVIATICNEGLLDDQGIIVAEHDSKDLLEDNVGCYRVKDCRKYGNTSISFIIKDVTDF